MELTAAVRTRSDFFPFVVRHPLTTHSYRLAAESELERMEWIAAINTAADGDSRHSRPVCVPQHPFHWQSFSIARHSTRQRACHILFIVDYYLPWGTTTRALCVVRRVRRRTAMRGRLRQGTTVTTVTTVTTATPPPTPRTSQQQTRRGPSARG